MSIPANKIVFVNRYFHPDTSATSQLLSDLCFYLVRQGLSVTVVTGRQLYTDRAAMLPRHESIGGVTVVRVATSRFGRHRLIGRAIDYLSFHASAGLALLGTLRRGDVVVAKTDPPLICVAVALAALIRGARLVNWIQDLFPEIATALVPTGRLRRTFGVLAVARNWSLARAHRNVVVSPRMMDRLAVCGIRRDSFRVIDNWSDEGIRPVRPEDNRLRREWDLDDSFVVGYSGNLGWAHDSDTILAAMRALAAEPRIRFLFVGGGARLGPLRRTVEAERLANVEFRPYQPRERLSESLSLPDVHLVTQRPGTEGLVVPSKLYGIVAAGRPVLFVGPPHSHVAQVVHAHGCGEAVTTGDGAALAEHIRRLARDRCAVARMAANARCAYERKFRRQLRLEEWFELLKETLGP